MSRATLDPRRSHRGRAVPHPGRPTHHSSLTVRGGVVGTWAVSTPLGVFVPQGSVEYVHECLDDRRITYFRFAQDLGQTRLRFRGENPDLSYFVLGLGASLQLARGVTPYVSYRAVAGYQDRSTHAFAAGLRVSF